MVEERVPVSGMTWLVVFSNGVGKISDQVVSLPASPSSVSVIRSFHSPLAGESEASTANCAMMLSAPSEVLAFLSRYVLPVGERSSSLMSPR